MKFEITIQLLNNVVLQCNALLFSTYILALKQKYNSSRSFKMIKYSYWYQLTILVSCIDINYVTSTHIVLYLKKECDLI